MINPHKEIKEYLYEFGYDNSYKNYGDLYYDDKIFEFLEVGNNKPKGGLNNPENFDSRFIDIISDPNNLFIERHENAGIVDGNLITLHNGLKVYSEYYGDFINVLRYNLGVHEPSEERAFKKVLNVMDENAIMVEIGSYWSMYSIWFMKEVINSKSYCIEPIQSNIDLGIKNFILNDLEYDVTKGFISNNDINLSDYFKHKNIKSVDLLHSDIQGEEYNMLQQIHEFIKDKKIKYFFISTHSNKLHYDCIEFLEKNNYQVLCSCDFDNESFQYDGFILSCPKSLNEIKPFKVGNRSKTRLISEEFYKQIKNKL
jgi:hypothetical protein